MRQWKLGLVSFLVFSVPGVLLLTTMRASGAAATAGSPQDVPGWLKTAAATTLSAYPKEVSAVVLSDDSVVNVDEDGRLTRTDTRAIKILTREGRSEAVASEVYNTDHEKIKDLKAWIISPSGRVKKYGKGEAAELALVDNDVYNESRVLVIRAVDEAEPGSVFGYEVVMEDRSIFSQIIRSFQPDLLPVVRSRISVNLPRGWSAEGLTFNHAKIEPAVNGSAYSWEIRDLPPVEDEPMSPSATGITPWLAIDLIQPADKTITSRKAFRSWAEVSRWLTELSESTLVLDDALAGKARQLTASATTDIEKIAAIGRYVQGINYVSIQIGTGRGGGYRPHSSTEVFAKSYGDCKDKANLMRAMLKAINIKAYLVSIYSGDPNYVRPDWPSPHQFNHCIIAVAIPDETRVATSVSHPPLGKLLIFDPTDPHTPVGDLPGHEQGSYALIEAGEQGALLQMPVTPPEANMLTRTVEVTLGPEGAIDAKVREQSVGQAAVRERGPYRELARKDYVKSIERWITRGATGAEVSKVEPVDNSATGSFSLDVEFSAPHYGQSMQGRLLVFKPAVVSRREGLILTNATRRYPVVLNSSAYSETIKFRLPAGFEVDELPDELKMDTPFGSYQTSYAVKDGHLNFSRKLTVKSGTIPASEYGKVRVFFEKMGAAEQSPVVLAKK
jgi:hypothetical protein